KAREAWIVGSTLKKQYLPSPQASCVFTESATLYEAKPRTPSCSQAAWFGGSYGISFWNMIVLPFSPFQTTSSFWKCSTKRPVAVTSSPLTTTPVSAVLLVHTMPHPLSAIHDLMSS